MGEVVFQAAGPWALSWSLAWYLWARSITSTYHQYIDGEFQWHINKHVTACGSESSAPFATVARAHLLNGAIKLHLPRVPFRFDHGTSWALLTLCSA